MEQFKEKLRIQNIILSLLTLLDLAFLSGIGPELPEKSGSLRLPKQAASRTSGPVSFTVLSLASCRLWSYSWPPIWLAMKDQTKLKKLFIEETDERSQQIIVYSRSASTQTFLFAGLAAAIIAGFFSMSVSLTIVVCVAANGLITVGFKMYYSKKY